MALCLGGVGIWSMHFIGMSSVLLKHSNGEVAEVRYNLALSLLSLVLTLSFVGLGMYICSLDRVFTMTRMEIVEDFVAGAKNLTIKQVQQMGVSRMLYIVGTNELHYLLLGGVTTGSGVVIMHYTGFAGIEFDGHIRWNIGIIAASIVIAFVTATTGFWILFRLLPIYPNKEILRQAAALVMSCAVLGTHYAGMLGANFVVGEAASSRQPHAFYNMDSKLQFEIGVGFAVCVSVLTVMIPLADLRYSVQRLCYELSRADDLILSLPLPEQSVSSARVRKYVQQRKSGRFNTNVIIAYEGGTQVIQADSDDDQHTIHYYSTNPRPPKTLRDIQDIHLPTHTAKVTPAKVETQPPLHRGSPKCISALGGGILA
mmetsp:Transcript_29318/g.63167  ORF Transcript_29318/g.63167 Transcript_29318/m.63167 type:complete len:371 (-) Transcript_29318:512-1624(-)